MRIHQDKLNMDIPIFSTYIDPSASESVNSALNSTFLSEGKLVREFEQRLNTEIGIQRVVALNSGTSSLHLALVLSGVGPGDEVILPAQTFIATGLVVLQQGAVPVFADINYDTGNISTESIRKKLSHRTKAIMPVHWGGYPCEMEEINSIAKENGVKVIEDAAHALGATYNGLNIGNISDFTCFSFQAIKHLTTGDGGAIACLTECDELDATTRRWFGINRSESQLSILGERQYDVSELGFKYHMNNYAAALGLANIKGFRQRLNQRRIFAQFYQRELSLIPGISLFKYSANHQSAYWLFGMHVERRNDFIAALKGKGIETSVIHQRIDRNGIFGGKRKDLVVQEEFERTQIHIPINDSLDLEKVAYIVSVIKQGW
jgi:perosamine synthetase